MERVAKLKDSLKWITDVLENLKILYQAVGGLAAKCYGSSRPLHDIDFYMPGDAIGELQKELDEYIEVGPIRHKDKHWDIVFMKLNYNGQQIEFGDADRNKYFDSNSNKWVKEEIDFSGSVIMEIEGIKLLVMPKQQLIKYKRRLNRKVDRMDISEIGNQ